MIRTHIVLSFLVIVLSGCGPSNSNAKLQWGTLSEGQNLGYGKWLVDLMPSESIRVCGDDDSLTELGVQAVKLWAAPIGRAEKLDIKTGCSGESRMLKIHSGSAGPCKPPAAGCSSGNEIWIGDSSAQLGRYILLHEVGHQWGLCDQYAGVENCAVSGPDGKNNSAVMGNGNPNQTNISADDIEGMRYLADMLPQRRRQTEANDAWKALVNGSKQSDSSSGKPNPAANPPKDSGVPSVPPAIGSSANSGSDDGLTLMMKLLAALFGGE